MNKNRILLRDRYFESAIMICIANIDGKDCFILEKRAKNIRQAGEISFPGGKKDNEINYNKDEVEKLLVVPIDFFIKNKAIKGEVEISNTAKFDVKEYNFPDRYAKDWKIPSRYVYIYMYENEPIWGITAEIICDFIRTLKEDGKVGFYEYR